jgi:hypothetical protein
MRISKDKVTTGILTKPRMVTVSMDILKILISTWIDQSLDGLINMINNNARSSSNKTSSLFSSALR